MNRLAGFAFSLALTMAGIGLAACGSQARSTDSGEPPPEVIEEQRALHGAKGLEVARIYYSDTFQGALDPMRGESLGLVTDEFYVVRIAPDATRRDRLVAAGFVRKVREERTGDYLHEFYNHDWRMIAWLTPRGELYRIVSPTDKELLGSFQIEGAAAALYQPPSGYGFDSDDAHLARTRGQDRDVQGTNARGRGAYLRTHREYPPVIELVRYRGGEAGLRQEGFVRERYYGSVEEELEALRRQRRGEDDTYGRLEFKDGDPVDDEGKPIGPAGLQD